MTEIINLIATIGGENLRAGRTDRVTPMFESTVETLTNTANVMTMEEFGDGHGGSDQINLLAENLICQLEKAGAAGGLTKNIAATTKKK